MAQSIADSPSVTPDTLPLLRALLGHSNRLGVPVYLIGGGVRDTLFFERLYFKDLDFTCEGDGSVVASELQRSHGGELKAFPRFLTSKLTLPQYGEIDFASTRRETYERPGALPKVEPTGFIEDLLRRDFSINTLALSLGDLVALIEKSTFSLIQFKQAVIDHHAGLPDVAERTIRFLHSQSFVDDPTRIIRAFRYCGRIGGQFESRTKSALDEAIHHGALETVSVQRRMMEVKKILTERNPGVILEMLAESNVLSAMKVVSSALEGEYLTLLRRLAVFQLDDRTLLYNAIEECTVACASDRDTLMQTLGWSKKRIQSFRSKSPIFDSGRVLSAVLGDEGIAQQLREEGKIR
jgi:tRNA nucleotidyltransferase/poly(A) polymerase